MKINCCILLFFFFFKAMIAPFSPFSIMNPKKKCCYYIMIKGKTLLLNQEKNK